MAKNVSLLLIENVENVGIVGDVVNVRVGYARNFLLPRSLATKPSEELVKQLATKRADAEKLVAAQRKDREAMSEKLKGVEVDIIRSCNDMGILYGAVTQQDIASALVAKGFKVTGRDVRMSQTIKRIENIDVHVKLAKDLDSVVKVHVKPDRELPKDVGGASASDAPAEQGAGGGEGKGTDKKVAAEAAAEAKADKPKKAAKAEGDAPKAEKAEKPAKGEKKK
jgi:large subunit ribosomal protein L9